jgi:hypothetical protein
MFEYIHNNPVRKAMAEDSTKRKGSNASFFHSLKDRPLRACESVSGRSLMNSLRSRINATRRIREKFAAQT